MENHPQLFDVCVVCALPEEARAFLEVVRQQSNSVVEERISPQYHYSYRFATIKNNKDESLNLHISWLPRYGPQEMTLHLSRVLEECQPRIAIMTGICAGDAQRVQLGDLVVAERTFTYDNGKFALDDDGRRVHQYDTLTYQLDANTLQFLGLFDDWKPLVAHLERPPSAPEQHKTRKIQQPKKVREIACHIKAMASGSAVRADHPFEDVQAPVRDTVAIDTEGAAFGLVMSHHPLIHWLVVKGVCDYADQNKNDAYHSYAAWASALYALSFIGAYVTNERLPRSDGPFPSSRVGPSGVWNVPFSRNPFFTGQEALLTRLTETLKSGQPTALSQRQAISGLGGIGKTQIAVEYVYRHRQDYQAVLWTHAATRETLLSDFLTIADLLQLPERNGQDQNQVLIAVKNWLATHQNWLLILDNADDVAMVHDFMPTGGSGHIILTSRAQALGLLAQPIDVEKMGMVDGTLFLLRRAKILAPDAFLDQALEEHLAGAEAIAIEMDFLPLALDQAGAYIDEVGCSLSTYLELYRTRRKELLQRRSHLPTDHPEPVATTWSLSFQKVEQANPAAADLLRLCAFLEPDTIPEDLISEGSAHLDSLLHQVAQDMFKLNEAIEELRKFSLVQRNPDTKMLSIHRLVQAVLRDTMKRETQLPWAERTVRVVNAVFPDKVDMETWPRCRRYLSQAQSCTILIQDNALVFDEAASLLNRTASYLQDYALYEQAELLLVQALAIREQHLGAEHPDTAESLNNLAELYRDQGEYERAEPLYQRALAIREQHLGTEHTDTAESLNNLAILYYDQGKYEQSELLQRQALAICEQRLGAEHPWTARSLDNLAILYDTQGKHEQAEPLYQQALAIYEQCLGAEHPLTAHSLHGLAELHQHQGKYQQAEALYKRALAIREQRLGPTHPETQNTRKNLAALLRIRGCDEEAKKLEKDS